RDQRQRVRRGEAGRAAAAYPAAVHIVGHPVPGEKRLGHPLQVQRGLAALVQVTVIVVVKKPLNARVLPREEQFQEWVTDAPRLVKHPVGDSPGGSSLVGKTAQRIHDRLTAGGCLARIVQGGYGVSGMLEVELLPADRKSTR